MTAADPSQSVEPERVQDNAAEDRRLRILIVANFFPPKVVGGAEIVAHRQASKFLEQGHEVAVLTGALPDGSASIGSMSIENDGGLLIYRLVHRSLEVDLNFHWPSAERRLISIISGWRPDVVHFHNVSGLGAALIPVARRSSARVFVTLHDHWGICFKNTKLRNDGTVCADLEQCALCKSRVGLKGSKGIPMRLRRDTVAWCLDQAELLLSPSRYLAATYAGSNVIFRPVETLSNGVDLNHIKPVTRRACSIIRFACFSYLGRHKGIDILMEALGKLADIEELSGKWAFTIAGHGELTAQLESQITQNRFNGAVDYVGRLKHETALTILSEVDVVVLPSVWPENEPVTMLEAIAAGKAQIASRIGGNEELVVENKSGILVDPGCPKSLALALERFVREQGLAERCGLFNAERRKNFDEGATIERLLTIYRAPVKSQVDQRDFVVICAGPDQPEYLELLLHRMHLLESGGKRIRFIWHEWAGPTAWDEAKLLWLWSEEQSSTVDLAIRALRTGVPLLVPTNSAVAALAASYGVLAAYRTLTEAAGLLIAMCGDAALSKRARELAPAYSRLLNAVRPSTSLYFPIER